MIRQVLHFVLLVLVLLVITSPAYAAETFEASTPGTTVAQELPVEACPLPEPTAAPLASND